MSGANQTPWPLFRSACYLIGKGVTFGSPLIPPAAKQKDVYSIVIGLVGHDAVGGIDQTLGLIGEQSLDHLLITPMIEAVDDPELLLREGRGKLKYGGHLVVLVDLESERQGVRVFHEKRFYESLATIGRWKLKDLHVQNGQMLVILKKIVGKRGIELPPATTGRKACIARYGALGDAIIMTPLIRALAEDGYQVTVVTSRYALPVLENNPFISNLLIQEREMIPNQFLGQYWNFWEGKYDKFINLSESIEGDLLQVEGRKEFFTPKAYRHQISNKNYYDYTLSRGGYTVEFPLGELYFTNAEERRAKEVFGPLSKNFVILWALNGSSHHKVYPLMETAMISWLGDHPDTRLITTGDYTAKLLEFDHHQLIPRSGDWSVRESLIAAKYADLVVGPETMMINAAGCFPTPKIVLLSHSTKENLTKHFQNDYSLEPDQIIAPCYPCHQLHYTKESCVIGEVMDTITGGTLGQAPICSVAIKPQVLLNQIDQVYQFWKGVSTHA